MSRDAPLSRGHALGYRGRWRDRHPFACLPGQPVTKLSFGTSTRAGARVLEFYYASPGGDRWVLTRLSSDAVDTNSPGPRTGALGLAELEAGGAHFVMAEFANEKIVIARNGRPIEDRCKTPMTLTRKRAYWSENEIAETD